ncbi:MAG: hypothetical protein ABW026_05230 [Microvirga sp.]
MPPNRHEALTDLDQAISRDMKRVSTQITLIGKLTKRGQDATSAKAYLHALAQTLKEQRLRRRLLLPPEMMPVQ